jgi:hypothetical protein
MDSELFQSHLPLRAGLSRTNKTPPSWRSADSRGRLSPHNLKVNSPFCDSADLYNLIDQAFVGLV